MGFNCIFCGESRTDEAFLEEFKVGPFCRDCFSALVELSESPFQPSAPSILTRALETTGCSYVELRQVVIKDEIRWLENRRNDIERLTSEADRVGIPVSRHRDNLDRIIAEMQAQISLRPPE